LRFGEFRECVDASEGVGDSLHGGFDGGLARGFVLELIECGADTRDSPVGVALQGCPAGALDGMKHSHGFGDGLGKVEEMRRQVLGLQCAQRTRKRPARSTGRRNDVRHGSFLSMRRRGALDRMLNQSAFRNRNIWRMRSLLSPRINQPHLENRRSDLPLPRPNFA
jgi:hypothetical protein